MLRALVVLAGSVLAALPVAADVALALVAEKRRVRDVVVVVVVGIEAERAVDRRRHRAADDLRILWGAAAMFCM